MSGSLGGHSIVALSKTRTRSPISQNCQPALRACWWGALLFTVLRSTEPKAPARLPPRDALTRARPVGEPGVAGAIGQAVDRRVAAETEILGARGVDRPAASRLAQLEQRAGVPVVDRLVDSGRRRFGVQRPQHLILEPWY